jgi:hypothetical protein
MKIIRQNPYEFIEDETPEKDNKKNDKKTDSKKDN